MAVLKKRRSDLDLKMRQLCKERKQLEEYTANLEQAVALVVSI
jgi:hypothetical protein